MLFATLHDWLGIALIARPDCADDPCWDVVTGAIADSVPDLRKNMSHFEIKHKPEET